ncbi:MAG: hypothetical protein DRP15_02550, partial [Candidatus Aenigmatarchaeota archaeon]
LGAIYLRLTKNHSSRIPIIKCLNDADIIIDVSGDTFSSDYGKASIFSIGARIISAKMLRKPVVLYCQSIGPFRGLIDRLFAKLFLKLVDLIIVREFITANYLRRLGVHAYVCADPAFLLEPSPNAIVSQIPSSHKGPVIGINLSQYIDSLCGGDNPANKYRMIMSQLIDALIERYKAHILIIPEVKGQKPNSYDDYYVSRRIVDLLKHKEHVTIVAGDYSPSELKAIVGQCDILISPRFHLVIFALSQCVPAIAIAYSHKAYGIMDMLGQSEYVLSYEDLSLEQLMEKVEKLWVDKACAKVRQELKIRTNEIRKRALNAGRLVRLLLKQKGKL